MKTNLLPNERCFLLFRPNTVWVTLLKWVLGFSLLLLFSCAQESRGFVLPEGDVESGKSAFVLMSCNQCHSVGDIEWKGVSSENTIHVPLGGEVSKLKSYGELVASIINPSHKIDRKYLNEPYASQGESKMLNFNDFMTVQDLVDLVTFLQGEYKLEGITDIKYYPVW
jgi:cytochrome c2